MIIVIVVSITITATSEPKRGISHFAGDTCVRP